MVTGRAWWQERGAEGHTAPTVRKQSECTLGIPAPGFIVVHPGHQPTVGGSPLLCHTSLETPSQTHLELCFH